MACIYLGTLDGSAPTRLISADGPGVYLPDNQTSRASSGWLLWVRADTLVAQRLDAEQAALMGEPVTLADGVAVEFGGIALYERGGTMRLLLLRLKNGDAAMIGRWALLLVVAAVLHAGCAPADSDQVADGRARVVQRFLAAAPDVGEPLPDLTIVDASGDPVNLREVAREHYTVLVLGCLT